LTLCAIHFSRDRNSWSSPSYSSTTFQYFPGISDLLTAVSKFQHHTKLRSKSSILLAASLRRSPICWWNSLLLVEFCFWHDYPGCYFTCTSCIICHHATQTAETCHILRLFLIYHNPYRRWYVYRCVCVCIHTIPSSVEIYFCICMYVCTYTTVFACHRGDFLIHIPAEAGPLPQNRCYFHHSRYCPQYLYMTFRIIRI
jgi:hypothetical protein